MHAQTIIVAFFTAFTMASAQPVTEAVEVRAAAASGSALLAFEIDNDTFIGSQKIAVPGTLQVRRELFSVGIQTVQGVKDANCKAIGKNNKVLGQFNNLKDVRFQKKTFVQTIQCNAA